jgi:hypothetical protein
MAKFKRFDSRNKKARKDKYQSIHGDHRKRQLANLRRQYENEVNAVESEYLVE